MGRESVGYGLVRGTPAVAGLLAILAAISGDLLMPGLYDDESPAPPPLPPRLLDLAAGLGVGVL